MSGPQYSSFSELISEIMYSECQIPRTRNKSYKMSISDGASGIIWGNTHTPQTRIQKRD